MATKKPAAPEAAAAPPAKSGKKRLIIIIVLVIVLIGISVGGTIAALKLMGPKDKGHKEDAHSEHAKEEEHEEVKPAKYLEIKPEIVVSFDVNGRQRFLKATVNAVTRDDAVETAMTLHSPVIANAMVMLISSKTFAELQTPEGKETLRQQALEEINKILDKEIQNPKGVEQVLFSEFIMQ